MFNPERKIFNNQSSEIFLKSVDGEDGLGWHDKEERGIKTRVFFNSDRVTIGYEERSEFYLYCLGKEVARVSKTLLDNGVEVWQLLPLVSFADIPKSLVQKMSEWESLEKSDDEIRREIEIECKKTGADGDCRRALGLLVYLKRKGWVKV